MHLRFKFSHHDGDCEDYVIVTLVALATLASTGGFHAFLLASRSGSQVVADGLVKAGIYVGQLAVCVQVTVVIRNLQIEWQALWQQDIAGLFLVPIEFNRNQPTI